MTADTHTQEPDYFGTLSRNSEQLLDIRVNVDGIMPKAGLSGKAARWLWDAATGEQVAVLRGNDDPVLSAAFSLDGARVRHRLTRQDRAGVGRWRNPQGDSLPNRLRPASG